MNNFTKYICAGLAIALLIIQAIMIWGLYGNFSGSLNELSDCTRKQLPQLIDLFTTMIVTGLSLQPCFSPCSARTENRITVNY